MKAGDKYFATRTKARRYAAARGALKVFDRLKEEPEYNGPHRWGVRCK